ncbi:MAG: glycosyltransferase [Anaerolineae bacterium]|nr:glycosyltransferase [Anaerolineae bacterium]MDW8173994.1 glycosyltransferase [Anaerolineae bacterium]
MRVLFVASLHHPQELLNEVAQAQAIGQPAPLFPSSMAWRFWDEAMQRRGWQTAVFWRNLPAYGSRSIRRLKALKFSDRLSLGKMARAISNRIPPQIHPDILRRNVFLAEEAARFQPDILWLVGDNRVILPHTLAELKERLGLRVVYASGVSPIVFSHSIERQAARLYDQVYVNDYYHGIQWLELGAPRMECLPIVAIDPIYHVPAQLSEDEQRAYACDVTFVGTLLPLSLYHERVAALEKLARSFRVGIWSIHDLPDSLKPHSRGAALGRQMFRVLSGATISLNTHGDFMRWGGNMRLFESAALGAFQLVDNRPGVATWFTIGEHLDTFINLDDLHDKVAHYLAHPEQRQHMVEAARNHVLACHTYDHRMAQVAAWAEGNNL